MHVARQMSALRGTGRRSARRSGSEVRRAAVSSLRCGRVGGLVAGARGYDPIRGRPRRPGRWRRGPDARGAAHRVPRRAQRARGAARRCQCRVRDGGSRELMAEPHARRVLHDDPGPLGGFERSQVEPERVTCPSNRLAFAIARQRCEQQRLALFGRQRLNAAQVGPLRGGRQRLVERCVRAALLGRQVAAISSSASGLPRPFSTRRSTTVGASSPPNDVASRASACAGSSRPSRSSSASPKS